MQQVMAVAQAGEPTIRFFSAYLLSFEYLKSVSEVLAETLSPQGKYSVFCNTGIHRSWLEVPREDERCPVLCAAHR